jgi:hypothetical protein
MKNRLWLLAVAFLACACAEKSQISCTMEAKACADGSYVGRDPAKNCEFRPCPKK